jgi:hypothetical protein
MINHPSDSIDLLLVWGPRARPIRFKDGAPGWLYCGRRYREVPIESVVAHDGDDDTTQFRAIERLLPDREVSADDIDPPAETPTPPVGRRWDAA